MWPYRLSAVEHTSLHTQLVASRSQWHKRARLASRRCNERPIGRHLRDCHRDWPRSAPYGRGRSVRRRRTRPYGTRLHGRQPRCSPLSDLQAEYDYQGRLWARDYTDPIGSGIERCRLVVCVSLCAHPRSTVAMPASLRAQRKGYRDDRESTGQARGTSRAHGSRFASSDA